MARATCVTRERRPGSSEDVPSPRGAPQRASPHGFTTPRLKALLLSFTHFLSVLASAFPGEVNAGTPTFTPDATHVPPLHAPRVASSLRTARPRPDTAELHAPAHTAGARPQDTALGNGAAACKRVDAGGPSPYSTDR